MPVFSLLPAPRGRVFYDRDRSGFESTLPSSVFAPRQLRASRVSVCKLLGGSPDVSNLDQPGKTRRTVSSRRWEKLADPRDDRVSFFRSFISSSSSSSNDPTKSGSFFDSARGRRASKQKVRSLSITGDMISGDLFRNSPALSSPLHRSSVASAAGSSPGSSRRNSRADRALQLPETKPVASGHGVNVSINLAEPVLFLQGYDQNDSTVRNTAMLRGSLHIKVLKSAKIKAVSLRFKGTATTKWPEGIPPKKIEFEETDTVMSHTWPFFNAQFTSAQDSTGADVVRLAQSSEKHGSPYMASSPIASNVNLAGRDANKRLSLSAVQSKSLDKSEAAKHSPSVAQKGFRTFHPGDYVYNFELPIDSRMPESIDVDLGSVKYELEAYVERAGAFRGNLLGTKELSLIRAPAEGSLDQIEPIAISRNWEDQLHYDIVISGKSFPLGAKVPIAFKLTPLAKVQCHRIKVFVTENAEYFCSGKRVHRMEPTRKVLLFEKRADGPSVSKFPGSTMRITSGGGIPYDQRSAAAEGREVMPMDTTNLLGRLDNEVNVGPTEMEFSVQLPGCQQLNDKERSDALHFDTTYSNIQVHHWIKIVMRLSKPDETDHTKRRHFEISIDSPFHILSCRASQANIALPAYSSPQSPNASGVLADCGCPGAPRTQISSQHFPTLNALNESRQATDDTFSNPFANGESQARPTMVAQRPALARPQPAHVHTNTPALQRPMHMLRAPSFNPPAFEDEQPPPPLVTPPPQYNDIASPSSGLEDYFSRLSASGLDDDDDEEGHDASSRGSFRGRVNVPLTPGSRMNRSMELRREQWQGATAQASTSGR